MSNKKSVIDFLDFTENENGKLMNDCLTAIRLQDPNKYHIGKQFIIRKINKGSTPPDILRTVEIIDIKTIKLENINEWIARLDTGYEAKECKNILRTMYSPKVQDIEIQEFYWILLKTIAK